MVLYHTSGMVKDHTFTDFFSELFPKYDTTCSLERLQMGRFDCIAWYCMVFQSIAWNCMVLHVDNTDNADNRDNTDSTNSTEKQKTWTIQTNNSIQTLSTIQTLIMVVSQSCNVSVWGHTQLPTLCEHHCMHWVRPCAFKR